MKDKGPSQKYFLDTNIFIYSFDGSAPEKQKIAQNLIQEALSTGKGVISYQVIQEFLNVSMRKFKIPLQVHDAKHYLEHVLVPLCEVYACPELFYQALDIQEKSQFSLYDSLIVAGAARSDCQILYSEDMQHDRKLSQVVIKNPFST
ncbi:MAG: PIN domain-containing protein [Gammaproteobacteria bacterium]|nr:PIN domain-containing protein [Gammaproteobacteria bacterium]